MQNKTTSTARAARAGRAARAADSSYQALTAARMERARAYLAANLLPEGERDGYRAAADSLYISASESFNAALRERDEADDALMRDFSAR